MGVRNRRLGGERAGSLPAALEALGIDGDTVGRLARDTGFQSRRAGKILPMAFLCLILAESAKGDPSCNCLAERLEASEGVSVSRQAMWKRVGAGAVEFLQAVLARAIAAKLPPRLVAAVRSCGRHRRVLVQDSTVIRLPLRLSAAFSGVANGRASVCNARVQFVHDLMAGQFVAFSLDPYSKSDIVAAPELELREGDLVLRDRGYLCADEIRRHRQAGADCIYRHKFRTSYLDPQTRRPVDLAAILNRDGAIDRELLLADKAGTPVRLVAFRVPEETANLRRMRIAKETKGHRASAEFLHQMAWSIFLTTIPRDAASPRELAAMYALRWRIETIFKAAKSSMSFAGTHNVSENQLRTIIAARLAMVVVFSRLVYAPACERIRSDHGRQLSLVKLTGYLVRNLDAMGDIIRELAQPTRISPTLRAVARYCVYDRRKRPDFPHVMEDVFENWTLG